MLEEKSRTHHTIEHQSDEELVFGSTLAQSIGYSLVVFACSFAGYRYSPHNQEVGTWLFETLVFFAWVLPATVNHTLTYERGRIHRIRLKKDNKQAAKKDTFNKIAEQAFLAFLLLGATVVGITTPVLSNKIEPLKSYPIILCAALPFWALVAWRAKTRPMKTCAFPDNPENDVRFRFRYRTVLPALLFCFIPFILAWNANTSILPVIAALAVLGLFVVVLNPERNALVSRVVLLVLAFTVLYLLASLRQPADSDRFLAEATRFVSIAFFGLMMTLVMAVAESFKVTARVRAGLEAVPEWPALSDVLKTAREEDNRLHEKDIQERKTAFYEKGTSQTVVSLPILFMLSFLHEATDVKWLWGVSFLALAMPLVWVYGKERWSHKRWRWIAIFLGMVVPLFMVIGTVRVQSARTFEAISPAAILGVVAILALMMSVVAWVSSMTGSGSPENAFTFQRLRDCDWQILDTARGCIMGVAGTSFLAAIVTSGLGFFLPKAGYGSFLSDRMIALAIAYGVIFVLTNFVLVVLKEDNAPTTGAQIGLPDSKGNDGNEGQGPKGKRKNQTIELLISTRPSTAIVAGLIPALGAVFLAGWGVGRSVFLALPIVLLVAASFVFNDLFDIERDRLGSKNRPLASGRLDPVFALISIGAAYFWASFFDAFQLGGGPSRMAVLFVAVIVYSPVGRAFPLSKGLYAALLTCIPIAYCQWCVGIRVPPAGYLLLVAFMLGRELLADVRDIEEDTASRITTLAIRLGATPSKVLGWTAMHLSAVWLVWESQVFQGVILSILCLSFVLLSLLRSAWRGSSEFEYSRVAMLFGGLAALFLG